VVEGQAEEEALVEAEEEAVRVVVLWDLVEIVSVRSAEKLFRIK
jgi:hypothetical protein